jgi:hypothetical protein
MNVRMKRPSPAFVVAMVALFIALGGTAGAVVTAAVPLAKRALVADNAKKLEGKSAAQIGAAAAAAALSQSPAGARPASTATGLIVLKTLAAGQVSPDQFKEASVTCDSGQRVMGGGLSSDGAVVILDSFPANDTTWTASGINFGSGAANVSIWATCLK